MLLPECKFGEHDRAWRGLLYRENVPRPGG
jgi:hypothetical protein